MKFIMEKMFPITEESKRRKPEKSETRRKISGSGGKQLRVEDGGHCRVNRFGNACADFVQQVAAIGLGQLQTPGDGVYKTARRLVRVAQQSLPRRKRVER